MAGGASSAGGWGGPQVTEITPLIWGVLLVLCWHVYAMGAASFQPNRQKQKVFFALYLCLAIYISWDVFTFEHLFSIALGVNAFFGVAAGLILSRTQRHPYMVHAVALLSTFLTLSSIYYWRYPPADYHKSLLNDGALLRIFSEPGMLAFLLAVFLIYGAIYFLINKCHHSARLRRAVFIGTTLISLLLMVGLFIFHRPRDILFIAILAIAAFALFIIAAYIERAFVRDKSRMQGIGLSMILFTSLYALYLFSVLA